MITPRSALGILAILVTTLATLFIINSSTTQAKPTPDAVAPVHESVAPTPLRAIPACAVPIQMGSWLDEHSTAIRPAYSSVPSAVTTGDPAQRMVYRSSRLDDGRQKVEAFKTTARHSVKAGWSLTFRLWVIGKLAGTYGIVGIEAFDEKYVYLNEADVNFTPSYSPAVVTVQFTTPPRTSHVAVYMQVPEIYATSSFDLTLDSPRLYAVTGAVACRKKP